MAIYSFFIFCCFFPNDYVYAVDESYNDIRNRNGDEYTEYSNNSVDSESVVFDSKMGYIPETVIENGYFEENETYAYSEDEQSIRELYDFIDLSDFGIAPFAYSGINWKNPSDEYLSLWGGDQLYITGYFKSHRLPVMQTILDVADTITLMMRQSRNSFLALDHNQSQIAGRLNTYIDHNNELVTNAFRRIALSETDIQNDRKNLQNNINKVQNNLDINTRNLQNNINGNTNKINALDGRVELYKNNLQNNINVVNNKLDSNIKNLQNNLDTNTKNLQNNINKNTNRIVALEGDFKALNTNLINELKTLNSTSTNIKKALDVNNIELAAITVNTNDTKNKVQKLIDDFKTHSTNNATNLKNIKTSTDNVNTSVKANTTALNSFKTTIDSRLTTILNRLTSLVTSTDNVSTNVKANTTALNSFKSDMNTKMTTLNTSVNNMKTDLKKVLDDIKKAIDVSNVALATIVLNTNDTKNKIEDLKTFLINVFKLEGGTFYMYWDSMIKEFKKMHSDFYDSFKVDKDSPTESNKDGIFIRLLKSLFYSVRYSMIQEFDELSKTLQAQHNDLIKSFNTVEKNEFNWSYFFEYILGFDINPKSVNLKSLCNKQLENN